MQRHTLAPCFTLLDMAMPLFQAAHQDMEYGRLLSAKASHFPYLVLHCLPDGTFLTEAPWRAALTGQHASFTPAFASRHHSLTFQRALHDLLAAVESIAPTALLASSNPQRGHSMPDRWCALTINPYGARPARIDEGKITLAFHAFQTMFDVAHEAVVRPKAEEDPLSWRLHLLSQVESISAPRTFCIAPLSTRGGTDIRAASAHDALLRYAARQTRDEAAHILHHGIDMREVIAVADPTRPDLAQAIDASYRA